MVFDVANQLCHSTAPSECDIMTVFCSSLLLFWELPSSVVDKKPVQGNRV